MKWIMMLAIVLLLASSCARQNDFIISFTVKDTGEAAHSEKIYNILSDAGYACEVSARKLSQDNTEPIWVYDIRLNKEPDKASLTKIIDLFDMENMVNIEMIQE